MDSSWLETRWARPFHLAFVFCLALGLLQAIKLYLRRQRLLRDLRAFPGPSTHWFYGHQKLIQDGKLEKLEELVEKYPRAFPFWVGPFQAFFYIYDPDYAKTFLSRTDPKSKYLCKFLVPCLGMYVHMRRMTYSVPRNPLSIVEHSKETQIGIQKC